MALGYYLTHFWGSGTWFVGRAQATFHNPRSLLSQLPVTPEGPYTMPLSNDRVLHTTKHIYNLGFNSRTISYLDSMGTIGGQPHKLPAALLGVLMTSNCSGLASSTTLGPRSGFLGPKRPQEAGPLEHGLQAVLLPREMEETHKIGQTRSFWEEFSGPY